MLGEPHLRFDHVGLNVADLAAAGDWYCAALGMRQELQLRIEAIDLDILMLVHDEHGHRFELLHRRGAQVQVPPENPAQAALVPGFSHMTFDVPDLDATHARLVEHGAREVMAPQASPEPDVRMSYLADPEGNLLELLPRRRA